MAASQDHAVTREIVFGVLSLILWALIVTVTLKYVLILLRADNSGEGGTLSLTALASRALGRRIFEQVSQEAWEMWEERMKMILNEYRLLPFQKEAQQIVSKHMEEFFFGEGLPMPEGYTPDKR